MYSDLAQKVWKPKNSVKLRFAFAQGFFVAVIILLLAVTLYFPVRQRMVTITNSSYETLSYTLAPGIFDAYKHDDRQGVINAVHRVEIQKGVKYVLVISADNIVYYDSIVGADSLVNKKFTVDSLSKTDQLLKGDVVEGKVDRMGSTYYNYVAPFIENNKILYTVRIGVDQETIDGEFTQLAKLFLYMGSLGIIIGIIAAYFMTSRLTRPIIKLTESALAIRAGNLNAYPDISTNDELEQLSREFQGMVEKLKSFYFQEYEQKKKAIVDKERLQEINNRLNELDSQKTDFLNAASHQLRTPLSVIHWSLSLIVDEMDHLKLKKDQKELLQESLKSTKRMVDLVNDLLDISRIEQGRMELTYALGNYSAVCDNLLTAITPLAQKKNLKLSYQKINEIPDSYIDEKNIFQVFNNFVDNAIKYTAEGWVKMSLERVGDRVLFRCEDSGIGMSEQEKKDLFTKFSRGDDAQKMFANGSGLGMYVARSILLQHGGGIEVESEQGKGTKFILSMPIYTGPPEVKKDENAVFDDSNAQVGALHSSNPS